MIKLITLNLAERSMKEIVVFMLASCICIILVMTCIVGLWRPMRLEVVNYVYSLLNQITGLIAGLLGAKFLDTEKAIAK